MISLSTTRHQRGQRAFRHSALTGLAVLGLSGLCSAANAADKPPLAPDAAVPFSTNSRLSASVEFGLAALAADIERDIPQRLASIDERISCVHRRVLFWKINANCDVWGYVERSGPVSLYGRGDRVYGSVPIYGALEGQGANRFTARIHGEDRGQRHHRGGRTSAAWPGLVAGSGFQRRLSMERAAGPAGDGT
jgi:hypothetical protein